MTHRPIRRFSMDGVSASIEDLARIRHSIESLIIERMRTDGYVPVLDLDPSLLTSYDPSNTSFSWTIVVQGVFVGKVKAWKIEGMQQGKEIPRSTAQNKSMQS